MIQVYFTFFSTTHHINGNDSSLLEDKYKFALESCDDMTQRDSLKRPDCQEILNQKFAWALDAKFSEVESEMLNFFASKGNHENFIIYSILMSFLRNK